MPTELAVAATAIVHFSNNLFKLALIGKHAMWKVVWKFGLPAIGGALIGALLLSGLADLDAEISVIGFETSVLNMILGLLISFFSLADLMPDRIRFNKLAGNLATGGLISGFFGGLSGHQGAMRSAFLIKINLEKAQYVATGTMIACFVDAARISTYASTLDLEKLSEIGDVLIAATVAAFAGALIGKQILKKITVDLIQKVVGTMMLLIGLMLFLGII